MRHLASLQDVGASSSIKKAGVIATIIAAFALLVMLFVTLAPVSHARPAAKAAAKADILPIVTDAQLGVVRNRATYAQRAAWNLYGESIKTQCDNPMTDPHFFNKCDGKWVPVAPDPKVVSDCLKELTTEMAIVESVVTKTRANPAAKSFVKKAWSTMVSESAKAKLALVSLKTLPADAKGSDINPQALKIANAMYAVEGLAKQVLQNDGSVRRPAK